MNRPCISCGKIVYQLEELKCLDQIWHRKCFRCNTCGTLLNMKSYRGFNKKPYCSIHYPHPSSFTFVADTPEFKRLAKTSKEISNIGYDQRTKPDTGRRYSQEDTSRSSIDFSSNGNRYCADRGGYQGGGDNGHAQRPCSISKSNSSQHPMRFCSLNNNNHNTFDHTTSHVQSLSRETTLHTGGFSVFQALFDYSAREPDEVSFQVGDVILNGNPITDGWMFGVVQRTGQDGLLPSNYVQKCQ